MSFFTDFPMYSPHKAAKLYQGFVFTDNQDAATQLASFANYKTLKWVFEEKTIKGQFQPISGLLVKGGRTRIRTNSLVKIDTGDILFLDNPALGGNKYFVVDGDIEIDGAYMPKWRQTFQHVPLKLLDAESINVKREL